MLAETTTSGDKRVVFSPNKVKAPGRKTNSSYEGNKKVQQISDFNKLIHQKKGNKEYRNHHNLQTKNLENFVPQIQTKLSHTSSNIVPVQGKIIFKCKNILLRDLSRRT